jgi:hypothetical protein
MTSVERIVGVSSPSRSPPDGGCHGLSSTRVPAPRPVAHGLRTTRGTHQGVAIREESRERAASRLLVARALRWTGDPRGGVGDRPDGRGRWAAPGCRREERDGCPAHRGRVHRRGTPSAERAPARKPWGLALGRVAGRSRMGRSKVSGCRVGWSPARCCERLRRRRGSRRERAGRGGRSARERVTNTPRALRRAQPERRSRARRARSPGVRSRGPSAGKPCCQAPLESIVRRASCENGPSGVALDAVPTP